MTNYANDIMNLLPGETPKHKFEALQTMFEALREAEESLTNEYWMTGEAAAVIRKAIDKNPTIIKIRSIIKPTNVPA